MNVRNKDTGVEGSSDRFNLSSMSEIIVCFDDGEMISDYIKHYNVLLSDGTWKDMSQAFKDKNIIPDNYQQTFAEPPTPEDKERGWYH